MANIADYANEDTIFGVPRGIRLYGLHTETSDYDFFYVQKPGTRKIKHTVSGDVDLYYVDFETLMTRLFVKPSHTDIEGIFADSSMRTVFGHEEYLTTVDNFTVSSARMREMLWSSAKHTVLKPEFKRVRLAAYLASRHLQALYFMDGRYNPTLTEQEKVAVNYVGESLAGLPEADRMEELENLFSLDAKFAQKIFNL